MSVYPQPDTVLRVLMDYKPLTQPVPVERLNITSTERMGFTDVELYGSQKEKETINEFWGISGRTFMQKFGTEICRVELPKAIPNMNFNNKCLWSRIMEKHIESAGPPEL